MNTVLKNIHTVFEDLFSIAFPNNCVSCHEALFETEEIICSNCLQGLPLTHYHKHVENPAVQLFWGRCEIERCAPLYFLTKHNKVHSIVHLLKYKNKPQVGERIGKIIGSTLISDESVFGKQDLVIPVPLHWKKEKLRGYNQSLFIAKGIEAVTGWKVINDNLIREKENISQTKKTKYERWDNVDGIFTLKNPNKVKGKNILLVDDVITTGATLEACVHALKKAGDVKVSIASIALASSY